MSQVTPGYVFTGATDPITYAKLNLLGQPTVASVVDSDVTTSKIANGAVTTAKLATGAVTTAKIADGSITTALILDQAITTAKLVTSTSSSTGVTSVKIADDAVTTAKILNDAVTTAKIVDLAVTTAKINDGAVTTDKLVTSTSTSTGVTTVKIADDAVTSAKLADDLDINGLTIPTGYVFVNSWRNDTITATTAINPTLANVRFWEITTTATITTSTASTAGQEMTVVMYNTLAAAVITFSTGFITAGTFTLTTTAKYYTIGFVSNGTNLIEKGRTVGALG